MPDALLSIQGLDVHYRGIRAVRAIDLHIHEGEHVTLIGANGAGKTSTLKAITGLVPVAGGDIRYAGRSIVALPAHERLRQGIAMVPEGRGIFTRMSVLDNLKAGAYLRPDKHRVADEIEGLFSFFPRLRERLSQTAGLLSGGEQQMLALARALLSRPRLLLLDEPSMGLSPIMVDTIFRIIGELCRNDMTLLLVEQNAQLALEATERAYVMDSGEINLSDSSSTLLQHDLVRATYLGE